MLIVTELVLELELVGTEGLKIQFLATKNYGNLGMIRVDSIAVSLFTMLCYLDEGC